VPNLDWIIKTLALGPVKYIKRKTQGQAACQIHFGLEAQALPPGPRLPVSAGELKFFSYPQG
jgi:hypothetical protein